MFTFLVIKIKLDRLQICLQYNDYDDGIIGRGHLHSRVTSTLVLSTIISGKSRLGLANSVIH